MKPSLQVALGLALIMVVALSLLVFIIYNKAYGQEQQPVEVKILQEELQNVEGCELDELNERMYVPIRIQLFHEAAKSAIISKDTLSGNPENQAAVSTSPNGQITTINIANPDDYTVKVELDYQVRDTEKPRQVTYSIESADVVIQRGTYIHEGFEYCRIFDIAARNAPKQPTVEEFQDTVEQSIDHRIGLLQEDFNENTRTTFSSIVISGATSVIIIIMIVIFISIVALTIRNLNKKFVGVDNATKALHTVKKAYKSIIAQQDIDHTNTLKFMRDTVAEMKQDIHEDIDLIWHVDDIKKKLIEEQKKPKRFRCITCSFKTNDAEHAAGHKLTSMDHDIIDTTEVKEEQVTEGLTGLGLIKESTGKLTSIFAKKPTEDKTNEDYWLNFYTKQEKIDYNEEYEKIKNIYLDAANKENKVEVYTRLKALNTLIKKELENA